MLGQVVYGSYCDFAVGLLLAEKLLSLTDWHATALQKTTLSAHNTIALAESFIKKLDTLRSDRNWEKFSSNFTAACDKLGMYT